MRCKACDRIINGWRNKHGTEEDLCSVCLNNVKDTLQWQDYCKSVYGDPSATETATAMLFATAYVQDHRDLPDDLGLDEDNTTGWPDVLGDDAEVDGT